LKKDFQVFFVKTGAIFDYDNVRKHVFENKADYDELIDSLPLFDEKVDLDTNDEQDEQIEDRIDQSLPLKSEFDVPEDVFSNFNSNPTAFVDQKLSKLGIQSTSKQSQEQQIQSNESQIKIEEKYLFHLSSRA